MYPTPPGLPIADRRDELMAALREHQVVVVAGRRTELNLTLAPTGVVRLDEFRVNAARELDAESISANEQQIGRAHV